MAKPRDPLKRFLAQAHRNAVASPADIWWSSLGDEERELLHGKYERRAIARAAPAPSAIVGSDSMEMPISPARWIRLEYGEQLMLTTAINEARKLYEGELENGHDDMKAGMLAYRALRRAGQHRHG